MTGPPDSGHERYETLMMKAVDGLLDSDDLPIFEAHLEGCADCRAELEDFREHKGLTDALRDRMMHDARLHRIEEAPATRTLQAAGWLAMLVAVVTLLGWGSWHLWNDPTVPPIVKYSMVALTVGALLILGRVSWTRLRTYSGDPYREVDQ